MICWTSITQWMLLCGPCCCLTFHPFWNSNLVLTGLKPCEGSKQLCILDVLVCGNGLLVQIHRSKTIQYGDRVLLVLVLANSPLCPVRVYDNMVNLVPAQNRNPAFYVKLGDRYHPISCEMLQKFIKLSVAKQGLNQCLFSSHNLCSAGALGTFKTQVLGELVKTHGDWASEVYLCYLEFSLAGRCQVVADHGKQLVSVDSSGKNGSNTRKWMSAGCHWSWCK